MNRALAPDIHEVDSITLPGVKKLSLDNGVPVYIINEGEQEVVKVELLFKAGKWFEEENLTADLVSRMLREGTQAHSAKQIADRFDYYGANFDTGAGLETASASVYSLTKHIGHLLPLFSEIITGSVFPQNELNTIISNRKQRLAVDLQKNDFVANRNFVNALFGNKHPYGRITQAEDFDKITSSGLRSFFKKYYNASGLVIMVAGKFDDSLIKKLNEHFGNKDWMIEIRGEDIFHAVDPTPQIVQHTEVAGSVQCALAVGNITINKTHPDFLKLSVLNTLFGGYFGSRLMSNIREDKGYTYGIYSSLASYPHGGFIQIFSEVGKEVSDAALREMEYEINRLRTELVDAEELQVVKNYISGKILRSIDGPLRFSETLKGLLIYNQDVSYLHQLLHTVRTVTSGEMLELANKYYDFGKMYKITVG